MSASQNSAGRVSRTNYFRNMQHHHSHVCGAAAKQTKRNKPDVSVCTQSRRESHTARLQLLGRAVDKVCRCVCVFVQGLMRFDSGDNAKRNKHERGSKSGLVTSPVSASVQSSANPMSVSLITLASNTHQIFVARSSAHCRHVPHLSRCNAVIELSRSTSPIAPFCSCGPGFGRGNGGGKPHAPVHTDRLAFSEAKLLHVPSSVNDNSSRAASAWCVSNSLGPQPMTNPRP